MCSQNADTRTSIVIHSLHHLLYPDQMLAMLSMYVNMNGKTNSSSAKTECLSEVFQMKEVLQEGNIFLETTLL